jgi:hypothetical protein
MRHKLLILALATAAAVGGITAAHAENNDDMSFSGMFKSDRLDANKDGMVSKAEFIAMMDKAYDMKAKEMKAKPGAMNPEQFKAFMAWLSRGEKN